MIFSHKKCCKPILTWGENKDFIGKKQVDLHPLPLKNIYPSTRFPRSDTRFPRSDTRSPRSDTRFLKGKEKSPKRIKWLLSRFVSNSFKGYYLLNMYQCKYFMLKLKIQMFAYKTDCTNVFYIYTIYIRSELLE